MPLIIQLAPRTAQSNGRWLQCSLYNEHIKVSASVCSSVNFTFYRCCINEKLHCPLVITPIGIANWSPEIWRLVLIFCNFTNRFCVTHSFPMSCFLTLVAYRLESWKSFLLFMLHFPTLIVFSLCTLSVPWISVLIAFWCHFAYFLCPPGNLLHSACCFSLPAYLHASLLWLTDCLYSSCQREICHQLQFKRQSFIKYGNNNLVLNISFRTEVTMLWKLAKGSDKCLYLFPRPLQSLIKKNRHDRE